MHERCTYTMFFYILGEYDTRVFETFTHSMPRVYNK